MNELLLGLEAVATLPVFVAILVGAAVGIVIGILPGLGPGVAISVLLPLTYGVSPLAGISLLLGIYCGAFYGGAVTSILIRTPGEASSIMTMFDGYPMAQKGEAQRALSLAFSSAFAGGIFSALVLAIAAPQLAKFTGRFGAAESAAAVLLALVCAAKAYKSQFPAAMAMVGLGFMIGLVGIDPNANEQRFTFGWNDLQAGLPLIPIVIGLFGLTQALLLLSSPAGAKPPQHAASGLKASGFLEMFKYRATLIKGMCIGTFVGIIPAVGSTLSTTLSYFEARRSSKDPESFGKGNPEGIVAAESANNSVSGGAMCTVLTLGIPGDAITAIIMGVFIIHGVVPGPTLFADRPDIAYGIFASLIAINIVILLLLVFFARYLAMFMRVDPRALGVGILALSFIGSFSAGNSFYNVGVTAVAGLVGWLLVRASMPIVPVILGLVMGDVLEAALRQTFNISDGSLGILLERPIALFIVVAAGLLLVWPVLMTLLGKRGPLIALPTVDAASPDTQKTN